jgi:predicted Zn-dependent protease
LAKKPPERQPDMSDRTAPTQASSNPARPEANERSNAYFEAVALYEQAVRTLQQHDFSKAAELLRHVMATYPEERELIERSRVYLALCERQLKPLVAEPQNTSERLYAATLALNAGKAEVAIRYLEQVLAEEPSHDQALYMMAVGYAQQNQPADAIRYLQQAIEANPENRALARMDPDLEDLRNDDAVSALLEPPATIRNADPKRNARRK